MRRGTKVLVTTMVAATVSLGPAAMAGAAPQAVSQLFRNCDEARAAGFADVREGEPGYSAGLDDDGDGVACESADAAPAPPAVPEPAPQPEPQAAMPEVQGSSEEALAHTGPSTWVPALVAAALVLVLAGWQLISMGYERLPWVQGRRRAEVRFTVEPDRRRRRR